MIKIRPLPVRPESPRTDCFPLPPRKLPLPLPPTLPRPPLDRRPPFGTLSLKDALTASGLRRTLGAHVEGLAGKLAEARAPNATLRPGRDGVMRGPEGQPLVTVRLQGGKTAYVDPNTNQYYLASDRALLFRHAGAVQAKGPMALPPGAQFSNSYFTVAEVQQLNRLAAPKLVGFDFGRLDSVKGVSSFEK